MNQRELKQSIEEDPNLTDSKKARKLNALCAPYTKMSDEELLQLVRDFTMEYGREPMRKDVLYDRELKKRFGPWTRMLKKQAPDRSRNIIWKARNGGAKNARVVRNTAGSFASSRRQKPQGLKKQRNRMHVQQRNGSFLEQA